MATSPRLSRHRMGVLKARQLNSSKVYGVNCSAARFSFPPMLCCSLSPLQLYSFALKYRTSCVRTAGNGAVKDSVARIRLPGSTLRCLQCEQRAKGQKSPSPQESQYLARNLSEVRLPSMAFGQGASMSSASSGNVAEEQPMQLSTFRESHRHSPDDTGIVGTPSCRPTCRRSCRRGRPGSRSPTSTR